MSIANQASTDLRGRMFSLIETLACVRELTAIDLRPNTVVAVLESALASLVRHHDVARCAIYLRDDDESLRFAAACDWGQLAAGSADCDAGEEARLSFAQPLIAEAARDSIGVRAADCASDSRLTEAVPGDLLCVPIQRHDKLLGVLVVYQPFPHTLDSSAEPALQIITRVLGTLIACSRLIREMDETVTQRTHQLESTLREAERLKGRYEKLSHFDELTGLPNRRYFFPQAESAVARSIRYQQPLSVMLMDIDKFKLVNDRYGHAVGDEVLRDIAHALHAQMREGDLIARFGGEEFVLVLPSTTLEGALPFARRIIARAAELSWPVEGGTLTTSLSLGLTTLAGRTGPDTRTLLEVLLKESDQAMYYSKRHGRNRLCSYADLAPEHRALKHP